MRRRLVELNTADSALNDGRTRRSCSSCSASCIGLDRSATPSRSPRSGSTDWRTATVPLGVLADAGATVGSADELLNSEVQLADLFTRMAQSLDGIVTTYRRRPSTLDVWRRDDPSWTVTVGDLVATTTEDPSALLTGEVNTLDILVARRDQRRGRERDHLIELGLDSGLLGTDLLGLDGLARHRRGPHHHRAARRLAYGPVRYDSATGAATRRSARTAQLSTGRRRRSSNRVLRGLAARAARGPAVRVCLWVAESSGCVAGPPSGSPCRRPRPRPQTHGHRVRRARGPVRHRDGGVERRPRCDRQRRRRRRWWTPGTVPPPTACPARSCRSTPCPG